MQQFFAEPSWITESEILIRGADLNHMKNVLRMKVGEDVRINDGQGTTYLCCLNRYEKDQAVLDVFRKLDTETELPSEIILFQGLPKGDKMEWIVQKSVELGAHKIVPFSAKRSVVKLDEKKAVKKQERWQLIAKGAAEQSGRGVIPEVCGVCSFTEALEQAESLDEKIYYHHTGYPGGLKMTKYRELLNKKPEFAVYEAIRRMMPKGPLGRQMLTKVRIYRGAEHKHEAQKPEVLVLK